MKTHVIASPRFISTCCFLLFLTLTSYSQTITDLRSTANQAEYIVISPAEYKAVAEQLASFRSTHNSLNAAVVLTDSIYSQFKSTSTPDSSIREFITYAVTSWQTPLPKYFVLAGNASSVPVHMEEGLQLPPEIVEDSIPVDWWFVEGAFDTTGNLPPIASLGRLPAWSLERLQTMVDKTITYQTQGESVWMNKAVTVVDYDTLYGQSFRFAGKYMSGFMQAVWKDTITVDLQKDSPGYVSPEDFLAIWNSGAAAINYIGNASSLYLSRSQFFTTQDAANLSNGSKLPVCFITSGGQRFERHDTLATVVNLLQANNGGAVAVIAATGVMWFGTISEQITEMFRELGAANVTTIGDALRSARTKNIGDPDTRRNTTVFGDPALTVRKPLTLTVKPPKGTVSSFALEQNYPNPFNPSTTIRFNVPAESFVTLKVYNLLGQEVAALVNEIRSEGTHSIQFDASGFAAGVYVYRMQAGDFSAAKKLVLVK